ncbi:hypothetical protein RRG08_020295 [Elysia crispata]|uniref:Uncharacterized protein n=1 Tax=Elysia crispata TaxID=231223 RepID=A0AAE1B6V1_9GAST|nr:hypothetical protein RRG08_020295 [Elysia crispata]
MSMIGKKWTKYCSLVGAHFATAPLSFLWSYGNIAPYLDSYYRFYCSPDCVDGNNEWVFNLFIAALSPGLLIVGRLTRLVDIKWLGLMSTLLCGVALIASAWTLSVSVSGTTVLLGVVNGVGVGICLNTAMVCVNGWAPEKSAMFAGSITSVPPILAVIQNQIVTAYVNPQNNKPDVQEFSKSFFSQQDILERVPNAILIQGCITLSMQVIGTFLITNPPVQEVNKKSGPRDADVQVQQTMRGDDNNRRSQGTLGPCGATRPLRLGESNGNNRRNTRYGSSNGPQAQSRVSAPHDIPHPEIPRSKEPNDSTSGTSVHYCSLHQAVRTTAFWTNSMYLAVMAYGSILKNGYVKLFGLVYIPDDNLLTLLISLVPIVEAGIRFSFGILLSKNMVGMKSSLVFSLATNSVLFSFFYFAPQVNFVTYLILVLGLSFSHGLLFVLYTWVTFKVFGPQNFAMVYSLGFMATTLVVLVAGGLVTPVLLSLGWFWLFFTCSAPSTAVLMATVFTDLSPRVPADSQPKG